MTLERGSLLNKRYRIVEILGQGGMAAVYRAIDENLGLEVAVKENLFTTEEYARQFRREAVILANLRQPNLPRVTDHFVIEQQGQYLVMDYIEGEDLRQRLERVGALSEQEVIILGVALCEALMYMHTRKPQVLHRDIKPGNVKITPHGQIYLVDFGLAKVVQGRQATTTGARAMTPGYSPPEQYGTARTDHRTDIYSVGATLYSALTDIIPEDGLARAMEQMTLTSLTKRNPKISKRLAVAIEKAMAVRPDDRYQSAEDLRNDLLNARTTTRRKTPLELTLAPPPGGDEPPFLETEEDEGERPIQGGEVGSGSGMGESLPISTSLWDEPFPPAREPKYNKSRPGMVALLSLLVLISSLGASVLLYPAVVDRMLAPYNLALPTEVLGWARWSPTPNGVHTPILSEETATATIEPLSQSMATPTATPPPEETPIPSPTLKISPTPKKTAALTIAPSPTWVGGGIGQIAFVSDRTGVPEIWLMGVDGSDLRQLTEIAEGACQPAWSPDGMKLVFISPCPRNMDLYPGSSMFTIQVDGSELTPLPGIPGGDFDPAWSPDGETIAFTSLRNSSMPQIHLMHPEDGLVTLLAEDPVRPNTHPAWSPDGKHLVFMGADNQIRVMEKNGQGRFLLVRNASAFKNTSPVWSPDGQVVVFSQATADMSASWLSAVQYSENGAISVKIPGSDYMIEPDFSPDGLWLVSTGFGDGQRDIYIMTPSGVNRQRLTNDTYTDFDPAWRP